MDRLPRPPKWRRYLRFWRSDVVADVDEELKFHLEARADDLIAGGVTAEAARAQALAEMGELSVVREQLMTIDERVLRKRSILERWRVLGSEFRYAVRRLRSTPAFTAAASLTLALAIGATASVFGLVDGVLLKAFPFRDPDRVLTLWSSNPGEHLPQWTVDPPDYLDWRSQNRSFTELAALEGKPFTVTGRNGAERIGGAAATPNFFSVLGITPRLGRGLAVDSGGPPEVVLSYGYWEQHYGGSRSALGQTLTLDDHPYTIVGVMPAGIPYPVDVWTRLSFSAQQEIHTGDHEAMVFGRLRSGVTSDRAQRDMALIAQRLAQKYPETDKGWSVVTVPVLDQIVGDVRPALLILLVAAVCVLLIGAANLANLFLVRCLARERDMAIRTALGASRSRLVRELLVEAGTLGVIGGVLGVGVAVAGVRALRTLAPPLPRLDQIGFDGRVIAFCALTSITTVLIFGVLPAWRVSRGKPVDLLNAGGRGTHTVSQRRLQHGLAVLQVAVALVLLTGAGLMVESFEHFADADPGFRPEGVVTAQVDLPTGRYADPARQAAFVATVMQRLDALPSVRAASVSDGLPAGPGGTSAFTIVGEPAPDPGHMPGARATDVTPSYFATMGIRLLHGRGLLATDDNQAVKVAVVDQLMARRYFGTKDPVGRQLNLFPDTVTIVGVVATVKVSGLAAEDFPGIYGALAQFPSAQLFVEMHALGDPGSETAMLRHAISEVDSTVPVSNEKTMAQWLTDSVGTMRFSSFLASMFAVVALLLGIVGIYSVIAYVVDQRRREIGVRLALGASASRVMRDVLRQALALAASGIVLGSVGAWILSRALTHLSAAGNAYNPGFSVQGWQPVPTFVGAAITFALVALVAASVPAFRTTRVNPVVALTS